MTERRVARSIILHIGTEKTGTTAIQHCCASQKSILADAGILYPVTPGRGNHVGLTYFAASDSDRPPSPHMIGITRAEAPAYRARFMDLLQQEIIDSRCETVLLSSEHLSSRLHNPLSVTKLIDSLRELADDVRVVVYLRPQYELMPSSYSTSIKAGATSVIRGPKGVKQHFYNYDKMLRIWENAVGRSNMRVRRFGKNYFKDGNLIADFFDAAGIEVPPRMKMDKVLNSALDAYTVEFLRLANPFIPPSAVDGGERERMPLIKALEVISERNMPIIPSHILTEMDSTFVDCNKAVAERYFPELGGVLFPPYAAPERHAVPELTVEKAVEIAVKLWQGRNEEIRKMRMRLEGKKSGVRENGIQPEMRDCTED